MGSFPLAQLSVPGTRASLRGREKLYRLVVACTLGLSASFLPLHFFAAPAFARGPQSLADLSDQVSDAVVNISATQTMEDKHASAAPQLEPGTPFDDLFEEFFRRRQQQGNNGRGGESDMPPPHQHERKSNSLGSGFVIDPSGIIITNNHVIADANDITVIFTDGQKLKAEIIGKDPKVDVAVLKVKPEKPMKSV
jgi:serine protease Do